jgi:ABC-2 type transport system permease protein
MKTILFILEKEFRQILRDPSVLRIMLIMPVIQLIVLPMAADYEIKNIRLVVFDHDKSSYARQLIHKVSSSGYFLLDNYVENLPDAMKEIEQDRADIIMEIPVQFEKDLVRNNNPEIYLSLNAINGVRASLGSAYITEIIRSYNESIRMKWLPPVTINETPKMETTFSNWYNVHMNYRQFMVPGILVILLTMVGAILSALNIVKEKEIGTIEQINVTPIRKHHFILGKLIPFWIMGQFVLTLGLLVARIVYGISPAGNPALIYLFSSVYLLAILGLGLLISSYVQTQQQAMLIAFFIMMVSILLGGLYTSIESMPVWAQYITRINPVSYFIEVMRMVVLKGSGLRDISKHLFAMLGFAVVLNGWAVLAYSKRN